MAIRTKSSKKKSSKEGSVSKRKRTGGTGLNDFFIGVFGLCFLLSVSLNFLHDSETIPHDHNAAVKSAIDEFKTDKTTKTGPKLDRHGDSSNSGRRLAELNCEKWGGPEKAAAQELVYWEDIPSDETFVSPFCQKGKERFMTFEPDGGGWSESDLTSLFEPIFFCSSLTIFNCLPDNIRMAMESVFGLAYAMCRTLVMPPQKKMYLLGNGGKKQRKYDIFATHDNFPASVAHDVLCIAYVATSLLLTSFQLKKWQGSTRD